MDLFSNSVIFRIFIYKMRLGKRCCNKRICKICKGEKLMAKESCVGF